MERNMSDTHKSNQFQKKLLLPCRCQHLINYTWTWNQKTLRYHFFLINNQTSQILSFSTCSYISSPSNQKLHRLALLESFHTDSISRVCISCITSKIAYHNEWAAGPPSSVSTDTTVVVSLSLAVTECSIPSSHQASMSFSECWLQSMYLLLTQSTETEACFKNTTEKMHLSIVFFPISSDRW